MTGYRGCDSVIGSLWIKAPFPACDKVTGIVSLAIGSVYKVIGSVFLDYSD